MESVCRLVVCLVNHRKNDQRWGFRSKKIGGESRDFRKIGLSCHLLKKDIGTDRVIVGLGRPFSGKQWGKSIVGWLSVSLTVCLSGSSGVVLLRLLLVKVSDVQ